MDSPVELSAFGLREWQIGEGEDRQTLRLAVHHDGIEQDLDVFAEKARKVVDEHVRMFGEAEVRSRSLTFLADYLPYVTGDGMEHRNSTVLTSAESLYANNFKQLGTLSHEFFHSWNVERLRPAELEPFDFTRADPTPSLWFAEGFTSYYAPLAIHRAGEGSLKDFLADINRRFDSVLNTPGRSFASPGDEPASSIRGRGNGHRPDEQRQYLHLVLLLWRRVGDDIGTCPSGRTSTASHWTTTCATCGVTTAAWRSRTHQTICDERSLPSRATRPSRTSFSHSRSTGARCRI
ncbi:MAG: hypothetical protein R2724_20340 [Bryobacterales bacterium]